MKTKDIREVKARVSLDSRVKGEQDLSENRYQFLLIAYTSIPSGKQVL